MNMIKKRLKFFLDNYGKFDFKKMKKKVLDFDIVSFDVFDTLIKRDVDRPRDVFLLIQKKYNVPNFYDKRIEAENDARSTLKWKREVTLDEIYEFYPSKDREYLKKIEIKVEKAICTANVEIIDFYNFCKKIGKKIIIISDMYLPQDVIKSILIDNGFNGFEGLFVSSELNKTKTDSSLFKWVLNEMNGKKILHIGDSFKSDFKSTILEPKITVFKVPTKFFRCQKRNNLLLCKTKAQEKDYKILESFISNHVRIKNYYYQVGFENLGPLLYGFTNWINRELNKEKFSNVLFLSRDSKLIQEAFDLLYPNKLLKNGKYFLVSRRSILVPSFYLLKMNIKEIIDTLPVPRTTTIKEIFDCMGLEVINYKKELDECGFDEFSRIERLRDNFSKNKKLIKLISLVYKDVLSNSEREYIGLSQYLKKLRINGKILLVDLGWEGTIQQALTCILSKSDNTRHAVVAGRYLGLAKGARKKIKKNQAKGYLFDNLNGKEKELQKFFIGLLETFFLERKGSIKRYTLDQEKKVCVERYDYEYEENKEKIREVQEGALYFVKLFKNSELNGYFSGNNLIFFENMFNLGVRPRNQDLEAFSKFTYLSNGTKHYFIEKIKFTKGVKKIICSYIESPWQAGLLKSVIHLKINYFKMCIFFDNMISRKS